MLDRFYESSKRIIANFSIPLFLVKKMTYKDNEFESVEIIYDIKDKFEFKGAVIKPKDNELLEIGIMNIEDKGNYFHIFTLFENILEKDFIVMKNKFYIVEKVNNHFNRGLNYLDFYIKEDTRYE